MKYVAPEVFKASFTCPRCCVLSQQSWWSIDWNSNTSVSPYDNALRIGTCINCDNHTLWINQRMVYPDTGAAPFPNIEMPDTVRELYVEAASISSKSPRGAAALLRLGVQVLCKELGEKGIDLDEDIKNLVSKGLPEIVQQSLDVVRVIGNNAVHPGQIDTDDPDVVSNLLDLLNIIIEYMIALPKRVSGLYSSLPSNALDTIKRRDGE
jgi:hypothetical protein